MEIFFKLISVFSFEKLIFPTIRKILEFLSNIPEQLLNWLSTSEARNDFYSWIIFTVIIGGTVSLTFILSKYTWKALSYRFFLSKKYSEYLGEYYLYHPPLIAGLNDLPRISKLNLRSSWLHPGEASQFNVKGHKLVYKGKFEVHRSVLFFYLNLPNPDECPKAIALWHFQVRTHLKDRIAFGTMCCINFREEPYRAPIIVCENRIPIDKIVSAFKIMSKTTITRDMRRQLTSHLNNCDVGDSNEVFEHILSGTGPIGNEFPENDQPGRFISFVTSIIKQYISWKR